ncbi:hypothetical protein PSTG_16963 [Puccinia striiformis f. sp. tritici PST-78]|uniref:Uncharacterized protein n=1 Tax=Puccinia striiformis f. sp. tritici PST-78 TaxID=1165861 RepID=A0A0L0URI0_9BASI|nr:hypothetical protein PSTG_16963 [Puccinia striiformis f. sp. tritici PST-78]
MINITTCLKLIDQLPKPDSRGKYVLFHQKAYIVSPVLPIGPEPFIEIHLESSNGPELGLNHWLNFIGQLHTTWHGPLGKNLVITVQDGDWDMTQHPVLEPSPWLHIHGNLKIARTGIPTVGYNPSSECGTSYVMHCNTRLSSRPHIPLYSGNLVSFEGLFFGRGTRKLHLSLTNNR